jgi:hypothetical protein
VDFFVSIFCGESFAYLFKANPFWEVLKTTLKRASGKCGWLELTSEDGTAYRRGLLRLLEYRVYPTCMSSSFQPIYDVQNKMVNWFNTCIHIEHLRTLVTIVFTWFGS